MGLYEILFAIVTTCLSINSAVGDLEPTFQRCCTLGSNWASEGLKCNQFPAPVAGVPAEYQGVCLSAVEICCIKTHREHMCELGKVAAEEGKDCVVDKKVGGEFQKDCCEACKLGLISGSMGHSCSFSKFSFGAPWDAAHHACCANTTPSVTSTSSTTYLSTVSSSVSTLSDTSPGIPTPALDSLCDLLPGELCSHICVPVPDSYKCECRAGFTLMEDNKSCKQQPDSLDRCAVNNPCSHKCLDTGISVECSCHPGFHLAADGRTCVDINECEELIHICNLESESCINEPGGYRCGPKLPQASQSSTTCPPGFRTHASQRGCVDIDECTEQGDSPCISNQICVNTPGSFTCSCKPGYGLDPLTLACIDINECQVNEHDCLPSQRCDNTIGSFHCIRFTSCGTGYTLNAQSGLCEDDDECILRTDNCRFLGPIYQCRNTAGSFRCERKRCEGSQRLNHLGICVGGTGAVPMVTTTTLAPRATVARSTTTATTCQLGYHLENGECVDINECAQANICRRNQRCLNVGGSYRCINLINCNGGYDLNEAGTQCVDVDECVGDRHECGPGQQCINRPGGYVCQCPSGHTINQNNDCVDVDECTRYAGQVCASNAECRNTPGSYICQCKAGFKQGKDTHVCEDVDECKESSGLCQQNCINNWGSYFCSCLAGYTLSTDNRTCVDLNECEKFRDRHLCIGNCLNIPGSYSCSCPDGYRLGTDGRTCQDIDECQGGSVCPNPNELCFNTRGSYRCNTINCPQNFIRDTEHKNRCKRASLYCREGDQTCLRMPLSYTYNYMTFVSNLVIPSATHIDLFTMRGPLWQTTTARFNMEMLDTRAPNAIRKATKNFFRLRNTSANQAVISLVDSIQGPQEIELQLTMDIYRSGEFSGSAVAKLFIYVSQYEY